MISRADIPCRAVLWFAVVSAVSGCSSDALDQPASSGAGGGRAYAVAGHAAAQAGAVGGVDQIAGAAAMSGGSSGALAGAGGAASAVAGAGSSGAAADAEPAAGGDSDAGTTGTATVVTYGASYDGGQFHLGPVDWDETQWHNACAPSTKYASAIREREGELLAGLWNGIDDVAGYCDACISVTTALGKSAILRVVTYGDTTRNSIDLSPQAYALLDSGEYPRAMQWSFAKCPDTGPILYEFQTGSSQWWTSLWVRNARVPIARAEVAGANHAYATLERGSDGTLTDQGGFGQGPFSIRLTGVDGQHYQDDFQWPAGGIAGQLLTGHGNFE